MCVSGSSTPGAPRDPSTPIPAVSHVTWLDPLSLRQSSADSRPDHLPRNHPQIISIPPLHYGSYLVDAFIQSNLQLIRLSRGQCGVKGLARGPNSCRGWTVLEPPTFLVPVMYHSLKARGGQTWSWRATGCAGFPCYSALNWSIKTVDYTVNSPLGSELVADFRVKTKASTPCGSPGPGLATPALGYRLLPSQWPFWSLSEHPIHPANIATNKWPWQVWEKNLNTFTAEHLKHWLFLYTLLTSLAYSSSYWFTVDMTAQ